MLEGEVHVGDSFRIGGAEVMATTPRVPCYKLGCYKIGINFGRADVFKRLLLSRRSGFSFAVLREGAVRPGDAIERLARGEAGVSVADVNRLYAF